MLPPVFHVWFLVFQTSNDKDDWNSLLHLRADEIVVAVECPPSSHTSNAVHEEMNIISKTLKEFIQNLLRFFIGDCSFRALIKACNLVQQQSPRAENLY
jgi:hypothetical protein